MNYTQPTFSSLQKMKEKSTQSQSAPDLRLQPLSHSANAEREQIAADPEGKRTEVELSGTLQGPHVQPDLWHLANTEVQSQVASKGKGKAIELAVESQDSYKEINFGFPVCAESKPTEVSKDKPVSPPQPAVFEYPDLQTWSASETKVEAINKRQGQQANTGQSRNDNTSSMLISHPKSRAKNGRYYSQALSNEGRQALTMGEKNHNLRAWSPQDAVNHHESRKELVPHIHHEDIKFDRKEVLAGIENDKEAAQRAALQNTPKVRGWSRPSNLNVSKLADIEEGIEYKPTRPQTYCQASKSMVDLRSSSAPALNLPLPSPPLFETAGPLLKRFSNAHTRAASTSGALTHSSPALILTPPPSSPAAISSSSSSSTQQQQTFQVNPDATFDAFLAPHKSGKGEAHYENPNAKKPKAPKLSPDGSVISSRRKRLSNKTTELFSRRRGEEKDGSADTNAGASVDSTPVVEAKAAPARRFSWESK